ncbi:hypothetical protein LAZ67_X002746 [Cordylochernes scorpioides]|uniref:Reverse transcriptase domain-containing protein n=1 Tax=Cordylochernes scorpioides TaxID=51811 RepID=A0ABY6LU38_9ARAC|nr:hypothetical protein LAZ67_X002746 [Cordylochernes scorpioides]
MKTIKVRPNGKRMVFRRAPSDEDLSSSFGRVFMITKPYLFDQIKINFGWNGNGATTMLQIQHKSTNEPDQDSFSLNKKSFENLKSEEKTLPNFYGLPKIHKPNIPLRSIVSYAGSPLYPLTKFLSSDISPFQKQLPHTVSNPIVAVEAIKTVKISNDSRMVSFDKESLYISIPHDEALLALRSFLEIHPEIVLPLSKKALIDLIKLCLDHSYFSFKDRFFRQIKGLPMGNPISSALANIFMNEID